MEYFGIEVKRFFKHFRVMFIITAILAAWFIFAAISSNRKYEEAVANRKPSGNTERVYGDKRVFDFANMLSDSEEKELEAYIHEAETKIESDIVIVVLNQSLADYEPEYKANYTIPITPDKYVMVYADKFWEDNKFGYDRPQILDGTTNTGDGVILVDNLCREPETNKIYTWMGTTGKCEEEYSSSMIDYALDVFYEYVESDYYRACIDFVDCVVDDLEIYREPTRLIFPLFAVIVALISLLIYTLTNRKSQAGRVTVTNTTYVVPGTNELYVHSDEFLRKHTTKVYNPPSSSSGSSGGGGHHSSGGGGSHGGGGHSR